MRVAIVIPTIRGREDHLKRCVQAYRRTSPDARIVIEHGHPTCGDAWLAGAENAGADGGFDYLHLTADDLEPHDGWLEPAVEAVDQSRIPAPLIYHPTGELESAGILGFSLYTGPYEDWGLIESTTVPFLTEEMWSRIGMLRLHYCTDVWVSHKGRQEGWETVIRTGMRFTHHTAQEGRIQGRAPTDTVEYLRAIQ